MSTRSYLSIGDVLTLLRQEFPDITISKIRFLESQGLVNPERTPSGYRKFYDHDVERLRWVLRQQREHFLPLKVIKDRLDDGADGAPRPGPRTTPAKDGAPRAAREAAAPGEAPAGSAPSAPPPGGVRTGERQVPPDREPAGVPAAEEVATPQVAAASATPGDNGDGSTATTRAGGVVAPTAPPGGARPSAEHLPAEQARPASSEEGVLVGQGAVVAGRAGATPASQPAQATVQPLQLEGDGGSTAGGAPGDGGAEAPTAQSAPDQPTPSGPPAEGRGTSGAGARGAGGTGAGGVPDHPGAAPTTTPPGGPVGPAGEPESSGAGAGHAGETRASSAVPDGQPTRAPGASSADQPGDGSGTGSSGAVGGAGPTGPDGGEGSSDPAAAAGRPPQGGRGGVATGPRPDEPAAQGSSGPPGVAAGPDATTGGRHRPPGQGPAERVANLGGVSLTLEELATASGLEVAVIDQVREYGLLHPNVVGGAEYYDEDALAVANLVSGFRAFGIEPRHLRLYKNAAEREAGFVEQVVLPLVRQRNPEARARAHDTADELVHLGLGLRSALLRRSLRELLGG